MRGVLFTPLALTMAAAGLLRESNDLLSIAACCLLGALASFTVVHPLDPSAYRRMARRHGWTMWQFHVGNVVLHVLPALYATRECSMAPWHGVAACAVHTAWGLAVSGGTLCLDETYVPLPPRVWGCAWCCAWLAEIGAPLRWE